MNYLSAQPDNSYFLWQLKVMLYNFERLGVPSEKVHVIVGYDPKRGINPVFKDFEKYNAYGTLFFYPDERMGKIYKSSIRPHILAQHFKKYPSLKKKTIFYHDCDIIFRERLDGRLLAKGETCFVSDASGYMNLKYINRFDGAFELMAETLKMDKRLVEANDSNTGGAQYILKNIDAGFWERLELDCEALYIALADFNRGKGKKDQIQAWCADMWAIYWSLLQRGDKVEIHKELDFCWPKNKLERWQQTRILHNAGVNPEDTVAFCKGHFVTSDPFFRSFGEFQGDTCTIQYVGEIRAYEKHIVSKSFSDLTFALPLNRNSNAGREIQTEIRQNIVEALSQELENLNISHSPEELAIHCAIGFGMGARYFNSPERIDALQGWLDRLLPKIAAAHKIDTEQVEKARQYVLEICGVKNEIEQLAV